MFNASEEITKLNNTLGAILIFYDNPEKKYIYLGNILSPEKGSGFGTRVMKCLVQLSYEKGYGGTVNLDAFYSSHLYYLYMGMIPIERDLDYISSYYPDLDKKVLNKFAECKNVTDLQKMGKYEIKHLISMLSSETKRNKDEITTLMLIENQKFLLSLKNKKCSYLQTKFIPELLDVLERNIGEKYPDTSGFLGVSMTLSKEGKERWLKAIKDDTKFEAFKNFEHLRPYMTKEQIEKLDKILIQNRLVMNSKENQKESSIQEIVKNQIINTALTKAIPSSEEGHSIDTKINNNTILEKQNELAEINSIGIKLNNITILEKQNITTISNKNEEKSPKISESRLSLFDKKQNENVTVPKKESFCLIL